MEEIERGIDLIMKDKSESESEPDSKSDTARGKNVKLRELKSWTDGQWKESSDFVNPKVN